MATYYVYSGAAGAANGTSWADAYTTLTAAFSGHAAGDTYYVAHDHAESTASAITLASLGTVASPTKVICVDRGGSVPPVSSDRRATAQVTTTGTSNITLNGSTHWDGVIFSAGTGSNSNQIAICGTSTQWQRYDNCSFRIATTSTGSTINIPATTSIGGAVIEFNNTTVSFGNVSQSILNNGCRFIWRNTPAALLGSIPTTLFTNTGLRGGSVECYGVDFDAAGSGKTLAGSTSASTQFDSYLFVDCKLNASVTKSATPTSPGSAIVDFLRCGSSGVNYNVFRHRFSGTLTEETTVVRSGGAEA